MSRPGDPNRPEDREPSSLGEGYRKAAPYLGAVYGLVGAVAVFSVLGYWLDQKVGNRTPWFLLAGLVVGMVGGFWSFFRTVLGTTRSPK